MIFVPAISTPSQERRGIVLLVVMALLTLFAAVGLSFVFYAEAEATAASFGTDAPRKNVPDIDPELLMAYYLGQLLYDVDDTNGVYSAMRGHSLARNMYGYNYQAGATNMNPYNGPGRLHTGAATGVPAQNTFGGDDYFGVNYTYYASDGFKRNPELYSGTYAGVNVSYTYPDLNNMFLAAVNGNGEVLMPSFFRPYTGVGGFGPLGPSNPNWSAAGWAKYLTLRPTLAYNPNFPLPEDGGGDVQNLPFGPGTLVPGTGLNTGVAPQYYNNDSIWMDLGFPVQIAPNGQKYKPLFAALIIDLDGKVNLNIHGNNRGGGANGAQTVHVSNQGYGPGEVNLSQVLTNADWVNLLKGNPLTPRRFGRYGKDGQPASGGTLSAGPQTIVPIAPYSMTNLDALQEPFGGAVYDPAASYSLALKSLVPGEAGNGNPGYFGFPNFDALTYTNGDAFERTNIWMLYNFLNQTGTDDQPFGWSEMEALLRYGDTGSPAMSSGLFALSPQSFALARARRLVTTHSFGLGRPGATPWLWPTPNAAYNGPVPMSSWIPPQGAGPVGFPSPFPLGTSSGEFGTDYRGIISALNLDLSSKLSLNRLLPDYPTSLDTTGRIDSGLAAANVTAQINLFNTAQSARQQFALDIFNRLCWVTTGGFINPQGGKSYWYAPGTAAPGTDISTLPAVQYNAFQWLAQLAVNIVDYIDNDSYITPFNWDTSTPNDPTASPNKWVYGTELPRLVINETYVEVDNDPSDPLNGGGVNAATKNFQVNLWAELLCPLPSTDGSGNAMPGEQLQFVAPQTGGGMTNPYPAYKLAIQQGAVTWLPTPDPLGTPAAAPSLVLEVADFTQPGFPIGTGLPYKITPVGTAYSGPKGGTQGFFVIGPKGGNLTGQGSFPGNLPPLLSNQTGPFAIIDASFATPIVIKTDPSYATRLYNGAKVVVSGVLGNTAANGTWTIAALNQAAATFQLTGSAGNGAYTLGTGTWALMDSTDNVTSAMSYNTVLNTTAPANYPKHNMILRRLACPNLPPNPYQAGGAGLLYPNLPYNPYVTVDYVQNIPANNGVTNTNLGKVVPPPPYAALDAGGTFTPDFLHGRFSQGRNQPYAATQFMNAGGRAITNAAGSPIVITSNNHGFVVNDKVFITGVLGNTNANNTATTPLWTVTAVTANTFTLDATSMTNAAYTSGGTAYYADRPQNTLFRHNGIEVASPDPKTPGQTLKLPFDWLVHMDRYLINPMEILQTSGFPPYLLTQQFMTSNPPSIQQVPGTPSNQAFQHIAPWTNASTRLYRFFEYVDINSRATGVSYGGRIPGKMNVNSIWAGSPLGGNDVETFMALCDPNTASTFQAGDVTAILSALLASRTPNGIPGAVGTGAGNDRPFRSFGTGVVPAGDPQNPQGLDIGDTFLRPHPTVAGTSLFDVPLGTVQANGRAYNPYLVKELLNKISNNLTTRSNTFAVFLTVGFFAVDQDTDSSGNPLLPPVLGAEIGKAEGRNIRHRMFALIDRTELRVMDRDASGKVIIGTGNINPVAFSNGGIDPYFVTSSMPLTAPVTLPNFPAAGPITGTSPNGATWTLQPGMVLEIDSLNPATGNPSGSGNDETVVVQSVSGNTFTATFYKNHPAAFTIVGRGNPGPATRYNPRNDTRVVPYFSIIE
jgi:hypothetical protein